MKLIQNFSESNPNEFCIKPKILECFHFDDDRGQLINQYARLYDKLIDALQLIKKCYSIQVTQSLVKSHFKQN